MKPLTGYDARVRIALSMSNKNGFLKGKSRIALLLLIDVACIAIASWFFLFRYQMANRLISISTLAVFFVTMLASIQVSRFMFRCIFRCGAMPHLDVSICAWCWRIWWAACCILALIARFSPAICLSSTRCRDQRWAVDDPEFPLYLSVYQASA